MMTLGEFAKVLELSLTTVRPRLAVGLEKVGKLAETLAAHYPGEYQPVWTPLAGVDAQGQRSQGLPSAVTAAENR